MGVGSELAQGLWKGFVKGSKGAVKTGADELFEKALKNGSAQKVFNTFPEEDLFNWKPLIESQNPEALGDLKSGLGNAAINENYQELLNVNTRLKEINDVQSITGHSFDVLNNLVNRYDEFKLIGQLENAINTIKPKEVYVCHPSYNQDHKSVYNASMIALRPHDTNYFVPKVFLYEQPQVYFWNTTDRDFQANYFVEINIDKKIKVYETMKSQVRSFRSSEHIRANSKIRGGQSNHEYAEAFEILRWVDG